MTLQELIDELQGLVKIGVSPSLKVKSEDFWINLEIIKVCLEIDKQRNKDEVIVLLKC